MSVLFSNPIVSREKAERLVNSVNWFHRVEPIEDLIAPGRVGGESYDAKGYIDSLQLGDVRGKRILEIGTLDGPLAYELAQRGAEIVASDIQDPEKTGFNVLREISGIEIPYIRASVYEINRHARDFEIVLFFGVFYHLKYPVLAFESISAALVHGGMLFADGEGLGGYLEDLDGKEASLEPSVLNALKTLDDAEVPVTLSYPGNFYAGWNWVIPNKTALRGWLTAAGFEPKSIWATEVGEKDRVRVGATAAKTGSPLLEHPLEGEEGGFWVIQPE